MAYNIIELNEKLTTELRVLAKEMGIRRPDAYKKEELIYKILDEQAIAETKKLGPEPGPKHSSSGKNRSDNSRNQKSRSADRKRYCSQGHFYKAKHSILQCFNRRKASSYRTKYNDKTGYTKRSDEAGNTKRSYEAGNTKCTAQSSGQNTFC